MTSRESNGVLVAAFAFGFFCGMIGFSLGFEHGKKQACASVKLEWVQDKCMKVTREAV